MEGEEEEELMMIPWGESVCTRCALSSSVSSSCPTACERAQVLCGKAQIKIDAAAAVVSQPTQHELFTELSK